MRHEQPSSGKNQIKPEKSAPTLPRLGYSSDHIKSISAAVSEANTTLETIVAERTHLIRAMNKAVNAHLDLERSSERVRKASGIEQELLSKITGIETKIAETKKEICRVFPEIFNQVSEISERTRDVSLAICGHPSGLRPRAHQECRLSASEKSLDVLKQQTDRLKRVHLEVRSELNKQLEDHLQDDAPSRKGLSHPSLFHYVDSPFESDAIQLTMIGDILKTIESEIEEIEKKYESIDRLTESQSELDFDLKDAQATLLRERAHKAEASLWVIDCDERFQTTREIVHRYLVRAGNCLIETLVQVDAEIHQGKSPKESSLAQTCQALGSLLYVSTSRQSLMGVSDLENKINLLSKTIGALDLEFDLQLTPNAESSAPLITQRRHATSQVIKVPAGSFQLDDINLLHEHGYRNRESSNGTFSKSRHSPEQVNLVRLNQSHLLIVAELLEQTWQKTLTHNEILKVLERDEGFGFVAIDKFETVLGVGIADIIVTDAFNQSSEHSSPSESTTCRLINLTSREEFRKLGCGGIITNAILAEAAARGAEQTVCSIEADNVFALKYLSDKHQFKSIGIMVTSNLEEYYVLGRQLDKDFNPYHG